MIYNVFLAKARLINSDLKGMVIITDINIRIPHPHELEGLKKIWQSCFSAEDMILFFSYFYNPELCRVAIYDNKPVAMGFLIPVGNLIDSTRRNHPCAHIYALATLPMFRGRGFASAIVEQLINAGVSFGYAAIALRPSEDSLFEYYKNNSPFCDWFYYVERFYERNDITPSVCSGIKNAVEISKISAEKYADLRKIMLEKYLPDGSCYIEMSAHALRYQEEICAIYGGGLYQAKLNGGFALLTVELHPDKIVRVKEMLTPADYENNILSGISRIYPAKQYMLRTPVCDIANAADVKKFAMLSILPGITDIITSADNSAPWCGLAFD